jgi:hypothetical protein
MSNPTTVNLLSPRQRFQQSGDNISKHRALVDNNDFNRAIDCAVNQLSIQLASNMPDSQAGMIAGFKLAGAQEFIAILKGLAETTPAPQATAIKNLNHNV